MNLKMKGYVCSLLVISGFFVHRTNIVFIKPSLKT